MDTIMRIFLIAAIAFSSVTAVAQDVIKPIPRTFTREQLNSALKQNRNFDVTALRKQIMACMASPTGPEVTVRANYRKDGTLNGAPSLVDRRDSANYLKAAAAAIEAVTKCQPVKLPAEEYNAWKTVEITFMGR